MTEKDEDEDDPADECGDGERMGGKFQSREGGDDGWRGRRVRMKIVMAMAPSGRHRVGGMEKRGWGGGLYDN